MTYRVLVVEDEALAAEAHAHYLGRLTDFELAGIARSGREAAMLVAAGRVDLILLDMHLPDGHGLEVLRRLRAAGCASDVIAVTSARDVAVVKRAVTQGVLAYLLKPFTFAGFRAKLDHYADYRRQLDAQQQHLTQGELDHALATLRPAALDVDLPKGLSTATLDLVRSSLQTAERASAAELAERTGVSRVTARRYLEHLVALGLVRRASRHGAAGRPEIDYAWNR